MAGRIKGFLMSQTTVNCQILVENNFKYEFMSKNPNRRIDGKFPKLAVNTYL